MKMTKRNKFYKKKEQQLELDDLNFEMVYDYIPGFNGTYPSFKILYDSQEIAQRDNYKKLRTCLSDFLVGLGNIEFKEDADDLNYVISSMFSQDLKKFLEKKCTMIAAGNNTSSGIYDNKYDKKIDNHIFYKINMTTNFVLEIENYDNLTRLDEPFEDKKTKVIKFFSDENLNEVIEGYGYNPDRLSVFVLRQIAPSSAADFTFKRLYEEFKEKIDSRNKIYSLKGMMKTSHK